MKYSYQWALVDIETTGLHVTRDEIIEIAVRIVTEQGVVRTWHRCIKPSRTISEAITRLTGITNQMVCDAPSFQDIATELFEVLEGSVFVAHNARFDYGFIKNAFKRAGIAYQAPVLCSIKLLKQLYPHQQSYNLACIAQSLHISLEQQHRAEADVALLHEVIHQIAEQHSWSTVLAVAKKIQQKSSTPSKLTTDISQLPESPGVYVFYGEKNALPLYIGKSVNLKQRILSHFSGDYTHAKEFALCQQTVRIDVIPTAGELSALLLESELIKKHMPVYNRMLRRKKTLVGFKLSEYRGYYTLSIVREQIEEDELQQHGIYGAFRSAAAAKGILLQLIKRYDLCPKLCGLEQGSPCFSYQLKRCYGACIEAEPAEDYNKRLLESLKEYQAAVWPYQGAIAIKEHCPVNKITQFNVFHLWRHLGTVTHEDSLSQWRTCFSSETQLRSTYDAYKILFSFLNNKSTKDQVIELV
ncbi:3'-5' exonuclease family protein [Legionella worsleiensis]|uniref:DNA-directed DNA polymerase n=1 Tax=Legionella worsleiensis TaxID=45076 RepID=A0A0W1A625_9GAMM|nr:3'-5' exonuclease family protein [Legionella worsleiensis]KTD76797.1 excinuclease ABC subunit C [Legionella worsleiensis]STY30635.1 excinuclease ABC subunit C [Legionella worsleiensis]